MGKMLRMAAVIGLLGLLSAPLVVRADDWDQVPASGGGDESEAAAPSQRGSSDDAQVIADFFAQIKSSPSENLKGCEVIGMFADMMAIARDQGVSQDALLERITTGFKEKAAERNVPMKWVQPIQAVVEHQVGYVYAHPGMDASQVQTEWSNLCREQVGGR